MSRYPAKIVLAVVFTIGFSGSCRAGMFSDIFGALGDAVGAGFSAVRSGVSDSVQAGRDVLGAGREAVGATRDAVRSGVSDSVQAGRDAMSSGSEAMSAGREAMGSTRDVAQSVDLDNLPVPVPQKAADPNEDNI